MKITVSLGADITQITPKHQKYIILSEDGREDKTKCTEEDLLLVDTVML